MKTQIPAKSRKARFHRGQAILSPEAGIFRDCGAPLMEGEDLLSGFKRAVALNPFRMLAKCADPKSVRAVQSSLRCNQAEAVKQIYTHMRASMKHDPFESWDPKRGGLIKYLGRGAEMAASKMVERQERSSLRKTVSLDEPIHTGEDSETWGECETLVDRISDPSFEAPDDQVEMSDLMDILRKNLSSLDKDEQRVLSTRFGLDGGEHLTHRETRKKLDIGRRQVDKFYARAICKLRKALLD
jgi:RNA polymerase sigma factor (sigma-70 family)